MPIFALLGKQFALIILKIFEDIVLLVNYFFRRPSKAG